MNNIIPIITIAGGSITILTVIIGYLNGRITRISDSLHKRIDNIEKEWRSTETCNAIHANINNGLKEIKEDIREIFKLLREK